MDMMPLPPVLSLIALPFIAIQLAWYIGVIVLLYKIWQKVKHLPS